MVDATAVCGEPFGRQSGQLEIAVRTQAHIAVWSDIHDAVAVICKELFIDIDGLVPISGGDYRPRLLKPRSR